MFATGNKKIMGINTSKLNFSCLPSDTKKALDFLAGQEWLKDTDWYLAGGTALALQTGNRKSVDLDFFTERKNFDNVDLVENLSLSGSLEIDIDKENTVYVSLYDAKVSFIAYPFFVPDKEMIKYGSVNILDKTDIAVMKIIAISQRGRKRDFFDLYWCAKNVEPLEEIIKKLKKQYPSVAHDYHHILKSMVYFDDAESDPEPVIFFKADWNEIKSYFQKEIPIIIKRLINLE